MFISQRLKSQKEGFHDKIAKLGRAKNLYHRWKRTFEANDISPLLVNCFAPDDRIISSILLAWLGFCT